MKHLNFVKKNEKNFVNIFLNGENGFYTETLNVKTDDFVTLRIFNETRYVEEFPKYLTIGGYVEFYKNYFKYIKYKNTKPEIKKKYYSIVKEKEIYKDIIDSLINFMESIIKGNNKVLYIKHNKKENTIETLDGRKLRKLLTNDEITLKRTAAEAGYKNKVSLINQIYKYDSIEDFITNEKYKPVGLIVRNRLEYIPIILVT